MVSKSLTSAYVSLVSHERSQHASKVTHDNMLERLTSMYVALGRGTPRVYESDLEIALLDSAKKDAGRDASKWVNSETTAGYLVKAEARLSDERYRANAYLCTSTDVKLQKWWKMNC